MPTSIALLRGINVAGHCMVAMTDLRALLGDLGFANPRSLLQSGNLVFETSEKPAAVERRLQAETEARLGIRTEFFVRTASDWRRIVDRNPFRQQAEDDPAHLVLMVLRTAPTESAVQALRKAIVGRERVAADGRHLYLTYPDGYGRSRATAAFIEKALATRTTARNWNTVLKIAAAAAGHPEDGRDLL